MAQFFKQSADNIRKSALVIPLTLIFMLAFFISCTLFYEDYWTSYLGYIAIPTKKANIWIPYFVALVPQVVQIVFSYIYIDNTDKRYAILIAGAAHFADVFTDVYYKANGLGLEWYIGAFIESEIIYCLFSEVLFTASFGMVLELLPDFIKQTKYLMGNIAINFLSSSVSATVILAWLFGENSPKKDSIVNNRRDDNNRDNQGKRPVGRPKKDRPETQEELDNYREEVRRENKEEWRQTQRPQYVPNYGGNKKHGN